MKSKRIQVEPKKEPSQERSRRMVRRILDASLVVLRRSGVEGFTINHVASEAGVSVASVYQFFPNKLAIIYRLYKDWLADVADHVETAVAHTEKSKNWRPVAEALSSALTADVVGSDVEYELLRAMWSHRELLELDNQHAESLGEMVALHMKRLGSTWPPEQLRQLAVFANELHTLAAERTARGSAAQKAMFDELSRVAYVALWKHAINGHASRKRPHRRKTGR
jgi:AcrR family transcriptional regulator